MKTVQYNNCAGGGGEKDLIYNMKPEGKGTTWAQLSDKEPKFYLTQMQTLNSNSHAKGTRSGSLKPVGNESRFMTVSDSYFNKGRQTQNP
jgi:hypothetical protein